jgi:hypothetical protein
VAVVCHPLAVSSRKNRTTRRRFIEMEGLRVELRSKTGKSTKGTAGAYKM